MLGARRRNAFVIGGRGGVANMLVGLGKVCGLHVEVVSVGLGQS